LRQEHWEERAGILTEKIEEFVSRHLKWIFPLPAVIVLMLIAIFPFGYNMYMSLHKWFASSIVSPKFCGLTNYLHLIIKDSRFHNALFNTFYVYVMALSIELVLGLLIALVLNKEFRGKGIYRTLILLPIVTTPVAVALVWMIMFNPSFGVLNFFLQSLGLPPSSWVSNRRIVIPCLVLVDVCQWTPLVAIITLGGLQMLPREPYEAAQIDGASALKTLRYITLPLLRPVIMVAIIIRSIDLLRFFDTVFVITQGGPGFSSETLNVYVFKVGFEYFHMGRASALLIMYFLIILTISLLFMKLRRSAWA